MSSNLMKNCMFCGRLLASEEEAERICAPCTRRMKVQKKPATNQEIANAIVALLSFRVNGMIEVSPLQAFKVVRRMHEDYHSGPDLRGFLHLLRVIDRTFSVAFATDPRTGEPGRPYQLCVGYQSGSFTLSIGESEDNRYADEEFISRLQTLVDPAWDEPGVTSVTVPIGNVIMGCYICW